MKSLLWKSLAVSGLALAAFVTSSALSDTAEASTVATTKNVSVTRLYTKTGELVKNRGLGPNTPWAVGKAIYRDDITYYQVATNEYLKSTDTAQLTGDAIPDYKVSYQMNLKNVNKYFTAYLNALHKANGTAPVTLTDDMMNYAQQRAGQQSGMNLDHTTATRETSENLFGASANYLSYVGVKSDKDAAYFLLKDWYDDNSNFTPIGQPGHFGHRAALIYTGPNVGLGITNTSSGFEAAFTADWDYSSLDGFHQVYNYTGSNPNTQFISKDSI